MKASDITDEAFLAALDETQRLRPGSRGIGVTRWDLAWVLDGHPERVYGQPGYAAISDDEPAIPERVFLAKAKRLMARGLIEGCACGCRGDFERAAPAPAEGPAS